MAVSWVLASQGYGTQVNHHLMTTAASLAAMLALLQGKGRSACAVAGFLVGVAGVITPNRGAYALAASLLALGPSSSALIPFFSGLCVAPALCVLYLLMNGAMGSAWDDVIGWTSSNYAGVQGVPFGAGAGATTFPFVLGYPAAGVLALVDRALSPEAWRGCRWRVAAAFALAGLAGSFPRPDATHLLVTAPLALPLLALGVDRVMTILPRLVQIAVAGAAAVLFLTPATLYYGAAAWSASNIRTTKTATGLIAFLQPSVGEVAAHVSNIPDHDGVFFYPYMPLVPVLTAQEHVASVDIFVPGYTTPRQYIEACRQVSERARWVVFDRGLSDPNALKSIFPAVVVAMPPERVTLERSISANFTTVWSNRQFDLMRRSNNIKTVCR
jgi:hypothetical protein